MAPADLGLSLAAQTDIRTSSLIVASWCAVHRTQRLRLSSQSQDWALHLTFNLENPPTPPQFLQILPDRSRLRFDLKPARRRVVL